MRKLLLIFLFFVSWAAANAQDRIITIRRDTIECRIVSVNGDRITYEQKNPDNSLVGKSISTLEVLQYYRTGRFNKEGYQLDDVKVRRQRPEHRWLFSLQGGMAHSFTDYDDSRMNMINVGNSASAVDDYFGKLKNGYHLNASAHYLLSYFIGIGVDYNLFYAASKGEFLIYNHSQTDLPSFFKYSTDERLYSHFTGVSVLFQGFFDSKKKIRISQTISPGVVQFRQEGRDIQNYGRYSYGYGYGYGGPSYYQPFNSVLTSAPFGAKGSLAIDYALTSHLSAGIAGDFMWAKVRKASAKTSMSVIKGQKLENHINISHLDYGLIVHYNF